jgi:hypothetical protein
MVLKDPVADKKLGPNVLTTGINAADRANHCLNLRLHQSESPAPGPQLRVIDVDCPILDADGGSIGENYA